MWQWCVLSDHNTQTDPWKSQRHSKIMALPKRKHKEGKSLKKHLCWFLCVIWSRADKHIHSGQSISIDTLSSKWIQNCNYFHHHVRQILHTRNRVCSLRCSAKWTRPWEWAFQFLHLICFFTFNVSSSFRAHLSQRCVWICACLLCLRPRCSTYGFTKTSTFFQMALVKNIALDFVISLSPSSGNVALPKLPTATDKAHLPTSQKVFSGI